jgi:hypothetical protein
MAAEIGASARSGLPARGYRRRSGRPAQPRYVDNWSLSLDATILWRTSRAVPGRSGAY